MHAGGYASGVKRLSCTYRVNLLNISIISRRKVNRLLIIPTIKFKQHWLIEIVANSSDEFNKILQKQRNLLERTDVK